MAESSEERKSMAEFAKGLLAQMAEDDAVQDLADVVGAVAWLFIEDLPEHVLEQLGKPSDELLIQVQRVANFRYYNAVREEMEAGMREFGDWA